MTRSTWLVILFVAGAITCLVATMPLSFALKVSGISQSGFTWQGLEGSAFKGKIYGASFGAQPIGDIDLRLAPTSLLRARVGYNIVWDGPTGMGAGRLAFKRDVLEIFNLEADFNLAEFVYLIPEIRSTNGHASIRGGHIVMADAACIKAAGDVSSDIVSKFATQYDTDAGELEGLLSCHSGALQLEMEGRVAQNDLLTTKLRLDLLGTSNFEANVRTQDALLVAGLSSYGFLEGPDGVVFRDELTLTKGF